MKRPARGDKKGNTEGKGRSPSRPPSALQNSCGAALPADKCRGHTGRRKEEAVRATGLNGNYSDKPARRSTYGTSVQGIEAMRQLTGSRSTFLAAQLAGSISSVAAGRNRSSPDDGDPAWNTPVATLGWEWRTKGVVRPGPSGSPSCPVPPE